MTKKDYYKIADTIKDVIDLAQLNQRQADELVVNFAQMLKSDNNRFCALKFGAYIDGITSKLPDLHELDASDSHIHARGI